MMQRFKSWWQRVTMPNGMAGRRTTVIIRRSDSEKWTEADQMWLGATMENPVWGKLMRLSEDSICCDVLDHGGNRLIDPDWLKGFVAGRKAQMDYQARHGFVMAEAQSPDPERNWEDAEKKTADASGERSVLEENPER